MIASLFERRGVCAALIAGAALAACAEDVPGVAPPLDQLHYPMGMLIVPGAAPADDLLLVTNSDFDQRFNAGSVLALSVDALFARVPAPGAAPAFPEDLGGAVQAAVRIDPFGGDLIFVPGAGAGEGRLYTPSRGKNRVTMLELSHASGSAKLSCNSGKGEVQAPADCTPAYMLRTFFSDPFAIAYTSEGGGLFAVGHQKYRSSTEQISPIVLFKPSIFDERIAKELAGGDPDGSGLTPSGDSGAACTTNDQCSGGGTCTLGVCHPLAASLTIDPLPGSIGVAFVGTGGADLPLGRLLVAHQDPLTAAAGVVVSLHQLSAPADPLALGTALALPLRTLTGATQIKAITVVGDRAYVSIRFAQLGGTAVFSAAIAVMQIEGEELRVLAVLEVGEELGKVFVLDRVAGSTVGRLLYVPDVRNDTIFVLDASSDRLTLLGAIGGRAPRTVGGAQILAHTLDGPAWMAFAERNGRRLGFVGNFANSTLGVIDVTDPNPAKHAVVERFGRVLNTDGSTEEAP